MKFPEQGQDTGTVLTKLELMKSEDLPWEEGKVFAYVYDAGPQAMKLIKNSFSLFLTENGLDPTAFPSAMQLEKEVIGMAIDLINGGDKAEGSFTSGGTESIILAIKSARDFANAERNISEPELLLPETAHPAFTKACQYLKIKPVVVKVNEQNFQAIGCEMEQAINDNTIMMVASAPGYGHGIIDPISELGQIALKHDILFHVDSCVGGMYLPFAKQLGFDIPDFDLSVPGVTSISMDFHKWGYAAKGASAVIYKDGAKMRSYQIFAWSGWTGYSVINPTVMSTKSAGPIAACWAILNHMGKQGYLDLVQKSQTAANKIMDAITNDIEPLRLMGEPKANLFAITSDTVDIFALADEMKTRGWYIQPQFGFSSSKGNVHLSVGAHNADKADEFISDLKMMTAKLVTEQKGPSMQQLPDDIAELVANPDERLLEKLSELLGSDGTNLPERMDAVNNVLNLMEPKLRDKLLADFLNQLYSSADKSVFEGVKIPKIYRLYRYFKKLLGYSDK
ncbi:aspartate aminotransferase family protein [Thalassotalea sp. Y01]|uniref:pyridoxal phosphate-dependent decarboxylase family protein n=1 Tax=Thalassotalea sp. Y01 TaxID=2729613 RepID=UPI00145F23B2|nr:aspartate aminotransferase family protein [Thalassotalea sp. Y01]NMP16046.1 aspartate aminotransferase family protein [Thalassotalea sp. Y01]